MSDAKDASFRRSRSSSARLLGLVLGIILPIAVLLVGAFGAVRMIQTPPQAERGGRRANVQSRLVDAQVLMRENAQASVEAMGAVRAARTVSVQTQVAGRVVSMSPNLEPGGIVRAGETLLTIDPSDYELAVRQREAALAQAASDLRIEMGQQEIARQDFELLGEEIPEGDQSLVLREPQLAKARADIDVAQVALEAARLDLERTRIRAAFDAIVVSKNVELGAMANPSSILAEMVGTDQFWVELAVPVDELRWIDLPGPGGGRGADVQLRDDAAWPPGVFRSGYVLRFRGDVDDRSRMATLIVAVDDPLGLDPANQGVPPLLLNTYLRAQIAGRSLPDVAAVPREHVHEGDTVWIIDEDGRLDIRPVQIGWRGPDRVFVTDGIRDGERLVTTRLSAPVQGMALRVAEAVSSGESAADARETRAPDEAPTAAADEGAGSS